MGRKKKPISILILLVCESKDKSRDRFSPKLFSLSFSLSFCRRLERHAKLKKRKEKKGKKRASRAFIFLVYRSRGALDNVRPRWKWLQYGRHPLTWTSTNATCTLAGSRERRVHACKWSGVSGRLVQKLCVRWVREKKKKGKSSGGKKGQLQANRRQFESLNQNAARRPERSVQRGKNSNEIASLPVPESAGRCCLFRWNGHVY